MANAHNLKGHEFTSDQSREEAAKNGRKGGLASGKKRTMEKMMRDALKQKCKFDEEILEKMGLDKNATNATALVQSILYGAIVGGSTKDKRLLLEMIGEDRPTENAENEQRAREIVINFTDDSKRDGE